MTKELEALKTIKIKCPPNSNPSPLVDNALDIVEKPFKTPLSAYSTEELLDEIRKRVEE